MGNFFEDWLNKFVQGFAYQAPREEQKPTQNNSDWKDEVQKMRAQGMTMDSIAKSVGKTREQVSQVLRKRKDE